MSVRVLRGEEELAEATERAAESARRLDDRLAARAAHDVWMAEHTEQRVGWLRFVRGPADGGPFVGAEGRGRRARTHRAASSSPAA